MVPDNLQCALDDLAHGRMVVLVDDADRENEGDLVLAAEHVTARAVNFMATHARGLICVAMDGERLDALAIEPMVDAPTAAHGTAFGVSVDLLGPGRTGISADDRAATIAALCDAATRPDELGRPGHVFPLRPAPGGLAERRGHTEASVELARRAGLLPAAVICEVLDEDGTMARGPRLAAFARRHGLTVVSVAEVADPAPAVAPTAPTAGSTVALPTGYGDFRLTVWTAAGGREAAVLTFGDPLAHPEPPVRVHSACLTGDAFGSLRCDCAGQLDLALKRIAEVGAGAVVYLTGDEGRGIGLADKIEAYALQDRGHDTVDANLMLGLPVDGRDFSLAADVLSAMGLRRLWLMTNNPEKEQALARAGLTVVGCIGLHVPATLHSRPYLKAKQERLGHRPLRSSAGRALRRGGSFPPWDEIATA